MDEGNKMIGTEVTIFENRALFEDERAALHVSEQHTGEQRKVTPSVFLAVPPDNCWNVRTFTYSL